MNACIMVLEFFFFKFSIPDLSYFFIRRTILLIVFSRNKKTENRFYCNQKPGFDTKKIINLFNSKHYYFDRKKVYF